jgi:hypothetical protein
MKHQKNKITGSVPGTVYSKARSLVYLQHMSVMFPYLQHPIRRRFLVRRAQAGVVAALPRGLRPGVREDALLPVFSAEEDEMILAADYMQVYRYGPGSVQEVVDLEEEMAQEKPDGTPKIMVYHVVPYVQSLVSISARS